MAIASRSKCAPEAERPASADFYPSLLVLTARNSGKAVSFFRTWWTERWTLVVSGSEPSPTFWSATSRIPADGSAGVIGSTDGAS